MKDCLPNLQLLEGKENIEKSNIPFQKWINADKNGVMNVHNQSEFKNTHYIPESVDLDITNFEEFYQVRKEKLKQVLKNILSC